MYKHFSSDCLRFAVLPLQSEWVFPPLFRFFFLFLLLCLQFSPRFHVFMLQFSSCRRNFNSPHMQNGSGTDSSNNNKNNSQPQCVVLQFLQALLHYHFACFQFPCFCYIYCFLSFKYTFAFHCNSNCLRSRCFKIANKFVFLFFNTALFLAPYALSFCCVTIQFCNYLIEKCTKSCKTVKVFDFTSILFQGLVM